MKPLIPLLLSFLCIAATASAFQPQNDGPCCTAALVSDTAPTICLTEADLIGGNWVEQFDASIASSHRVWAFNRLGHLDISTVFEDGYVEAEVASWKLEYHHGQNYLSILDPVLGEKVTYQVKMVNGGIQVQEIGINEVLEFSYQPGAAKAF